MGSFPKTILGRRWCTPYGVVMQTLHHNCIGCVGPSMLRVIRKMVADAADAEDLLQDAFIAFWVRCPDFAKTPAHATLHAVWRF